MTKHSNFAPSAAERWLNCPASISLSASAVRLYDANKSSPFASAGTAAHAVAALCFTAYRNPLWGLSCETADDPELAEAILPYVAAVVEDLEDPSACAYVESKLHWIADSRLFGTPDAIVASDFEKTVTDYKHGQFTFCAADSAQLQIYGFLASSPSTERLTLRVVQPRYISRHPIVREHVITDVPAWRAAFGARIETAIKAVDETPGKCNPGPHCIWCKGSPICEAMRGLITATKEIGEMKEPNETSLKFVLDNEKIVTQAIKRAKEYAIHALGNDREIEGYKLIDARGSRRWESADKTVINALKRKGVKTGDLFTKKLISPSQAAKLAELDEAFCAKHVSREDKGKKLVKDTPPPSSAAAFSKAPLDEAELDKLVEDF